VAEHSDEHVKPETAGLTDPWVIGQGMLILAVCIGAWWIATTSDNAAQTGTRLVGAVLIALALWLGAAAGAGLGRNLRATVVPIRDGELVTRGVYARVRHPIYTAVILAVVGVALLSGRWWYGLASGLLAYAYFDRKAAAEERLLSQRYPDYKEYRQAVGKLIPKPRRDNR